MRNITTKEIQAVLTIVKNPEASYNAHSLAKVLDISSMGALKILKRLEKESILKSKQIGRSAIYRINVENEYARKHVVFLLSREVLHSSPLVKRWAQELKKIQNADMVILFGSVLEKQDPHDIDALLVTSQKKYPSLQQEIKELNHINVKQIHPLYQSSADIIKNIRKRDKPLLNAIKGVVIFGEELFLEVCHESRQE